MRAPGRTSCSLRFFFDVMGSIAPPGLWYAQSKRSTTGRQWMGRDTRKNQVPSAKIIHPSYQQRGHQGRMSCSLRLFFDVMGSIAPPGLRAAQTYGSSTAGNKWDGTPGRTRYHRQRSSIISMKRAPGWTYQAHELLTMVLLSMIQ